MKHNQQSLNDFGRIQDLVSNLLPTNEPFLYYMPVLLKEKDMEDIPLRSVVNLAILAQKKERDPIVDDALRILNQLVDSQTGTLREPHASFFMDNAHFFWGELGTHTSAPSVIQHILNKLMFLNSLENQ